MSQNNRSISSKQNSQFSTKTEPSPRSTFFDKAEAEVTAQNIILVVDDSPTICRLVTTTLEKRGYKVYTATDGMEALVKLSDIAPDLILLDITMPRLDGYKLCKIIKGNKEIGHTPVVMLSGKDGFFDRVKGRMAGASDYITKPFKPIALLQVVTKHVNS